jgi:hypothetical protein
MSKKNKNLLIYIIIGIILLVVIIYLFIFITPNSNNTENDNVNSTNLITNNSENLSNNKKDIINDYTFMQEIIISDENSYTKISKNKLLKTAVIESDFFINTNEVVNDFMDLRDLMTNMVCGMYQLSLFDPDGLEEFNKQIEEWNNSEFVISDDSPDDQKEETFSKDILDGYNISKAHLKIIAENKEIVSECIITGKDEKDIEIKKYYLQ